MNLSSLSTQLKVLSVVALAAAAIPAIPQSATLPKQVRQPTAAKVVAEHMAALDACDWKRIVAQFPDNVQFFSSTGVVQGRAAVAQMFATVVKPPSQGGICGLKFTPEHTFVVDGVINVQWRADAPFLSEPYRGSDAYETKDGLMAAQVTTFDNSGLKMKR
jgi:hypothetical protein